VLSLGVKSGRNNCFVHLFEREGDIFLAILGDTLSKVLILSQAEYQTKDDFGHLFLRPRVLAELAKEAIIGITKTSSHWNC
jgi:hypothetical protein